MKDFGSKISRTENGFWYGGEFRELNERTVLLDGSLTEEEAAAVQHVYCDILEAFNGPELSVRDPDQNKGGREPSCAAPRQPVTVYIAPDVYWIDDPGATDTMQKKEGYSLPFGMYVNCEALKIVGLSDNPEDVVIAGNRGQSHACNGNYTMIYFQVKELTVSNLTLGNYCSVDLVYPFNPARNHPRRTEAVTQAQLAIQQGEKLYAKNCRFVSRLNLNPVCGAERALYENCHFESTDDALNGNAVYVGCDFDFYGGRPVFQAIRTGDVFINCLFRSRIRSDGGESHQYLTKEGGPVTLINCRYESNDDVKLGWTKYPKASLKCFQYQVSQNGRPVILGGEAAAETVQLQGKKALEAYLYEQDGQRFVNVGNLLGGSDEWDPAGVLDQAKSAGKTGIPTLLVLSADKDTVISGKTAVMLTAQALLFSHEACEEQISFSVKAEDEEFLHIRKSGSHSCIAEGCNHGPEARKVVVHACTESGLEAAAEVTVEPYVLQAPVFMQNPYIRKCGKVLTLEYELSVDDRADASEISWYRCDRAERETTDRETTDRETTDRQSGFKDIMSGESACNAGVNAENTCGKAAEDEGIVLCGVSRRNHPLKRYYLTEADEGKYMKAVICPKVKGSMAGEAASVIMAEPVAEDEVERNRLFTDFSGMPDENQTMVQRGRWTLDCAKPADIEVNSAAFGSWTMNESLPAWKYGVTGNGSVGAGLYQNTQGARLRYTPVTAHRGDMSMTVKADPAKTAGQGFGSAWQYMDFGIKFNTERLTGYALRVIRVREASDAVAMALVEYRDGRSSYLTGLQKTSCFLTDCTISVICAGKRLTARASTEAPQPVHKAEKGYVREIELETEVEGNPYDGILVWHTGTPGTGGWQNTTMLHSIEVEYGD